MRSTLRTTTLCLTPLLLWSCSESSSQSRTAEVTVLLRGSPRMSGDTASVLASWIRNTFPLTGAYELGLLFTTVRRDGVWSEPVTSAIWET